MIKLPKEISNIIKVMDEKNYECYIVGGCVRDSLLGQQPLDWDMATSASWEEVIKIFPDGKVLSEKYSVVRLNFENQSKPEESTIVEIATMRQEGEYSDFRRPDEVSFTKSIEEDLARRDFTINAMAEHPHKGFFDPYNGKEDLKNQKIKMIGDPKERLKQDPSRILRAIRLVAELDFKLDDDLKDSILAEASLMEHVAKEKVLEEFLRILGAEHAGKALRLMAGLDLMPYVIPEDIAFNMKRYELEDFSTYCDNINRTKKNPIRRLGLFYLIFAEKRSHRAIDMLPHSAENLQHFYDAAEFMHKIYFLKTKIELKRFIVKIGMERYLFLQNLAKAQRLVYDLIEDKIVSRDYMLKVIQNEKEPLFIEDLAINGDDLIAAGFKQGENIGEMLSMLLDATIKKPYLNEKQALLKLAKLYRKSWIRRITRNVQWVK